MALTITNLNRSVGGNKRRCQATIQFDSSYPAGGESLTPTQLGMHKIESLFTTLDTDGADTSSYTVSWDKTNEKLQVFRAAAASPTAIVGSTGTITDDNDAATKGHALYVIPAGGIVPPAANLQAEASATGLITDLDAPGGGVAVYVVVDDANWNPTYQLGHFEFVSPTDANGSCTIANGAETLTLFDDDDAASNGVAVRAVAAGGGLEATTAASKDILVPLSSGKYIHVNHGTTGSTPTVYFDEDAGNSYERLTTEAVDDTDEPFKLFVNSIAATEDIPFAPNWAGIGQLGQLVTVGPKPFTYAVGSGGPEIYIQSRPDAATLPGAAAVGAIAAGGGLSASNFGGQDLFIPTSTGEFVRIAYEASPTGVQLYGYPEGATADVRILEVVVDNEDETFTTETSVGWVRETTANAQQALAEATAGTNLSALYVYVEAIGV